MLYLLFLNLIYPPFFFFQGSLQIHYQLSKEESHVFTINTENLANRRVHQVKMSRDGPELSIQVLHFSPFCTAYMPRLLHQTCLSSTKPHTGAQSCHRLQFSPQPLILPSRGKELEIQIFESPTRAIPSETIREEETLEILVVVKFNQLLT